MTSISDEKIDKLDDLEDTQIDNYGPDNSAVDPSSEVMDIDSAVKDVYGNKPKAGEPWTMGDEVEKDEKERRGMD